MKRNYMLLLFLLATVSILAQTPEKMSYQVVLRDASNTLLTNQEVGMQISILQTTITGTAVYIETQTKTTNTNGLVSIAIGTGTSSDDFSAIDWSAGPYFIKTATDPSGGSSYSITGTSQLMSVPFAMYAKTSGSATPGPQGEPGANGTNGAPGIQGVKGTAGADGATGTAGAAGTNGEKGDTGAQGTQGETGITGSAGINGATGADGTNRSNGAKGDQGVKGTAGADGATGTAGADGATGTAGAAGTNGEKGDTGAQGTQGETGITGSAGTNGATGIQGETGTAGADGTNGTNGTPGIQGETGTAGAAGTNGADGATGTAGADGTNGTNGADGATGTAGADGATGTVGIANGGTNITTYTQGDILYATSATELTKLPAGTAGQVLTMNTGATAPEWVTGTTGTTATYAIGDTHQGGIIFYLDASGKHGLISAPTDQSVGIPWYNGSYLDTYAYGNGIGAGEGNTQGIRKWQGTCRLSCYASELCQDLSLSEKSDWYLPSKYELNLMYQNIGQGNALGLGNIGNFSNLYYWSSTENSYHFAWRQNFGSGVQDYNNKSHINVSVRAVRAF